MQDIALTDRDVADPATFLAALDEDCSDQSVALSRTRAAPNAPTSASG